MLYTHEGAPCIFEDGATEGVLCEDLIPIQKLPKPSTEVKSAPKAPGAKSHTPKAPGCKEPRKDAPKAAPVHGASRAALLKGMPPGVG